VITGNIRYIYNTFTNSINLHSTIFFSYFYIIKHYTQCIAHYIHIVYCIEEEIERSRREMQGLQETTPHRPPPHPQVPPRQPFQATPWLPVKQDKIQQYEISMPVDVSIETVSQQNDDSQQSVRPKTRQLAVHTENVPPSAVSWHQLGTCPSTFVQHQPSAHAQGPDNPFFGLPTPMPMSSVSPHPSNVPTVLSQTNIHDNVTTIQASPHVASRMPTGLSPSPNDPYLPPALTVPPKTYIPTCPGMIQAPNMYTSPYGLQSPSAMAVSPQTNFPGHPTASQVPPSFCYGVPNAIYSKPPDTVQPPAPAAPSPSPVCVCQNRS